MLLRIKAIHSFAFDVNSDQAVQRKLYSEAQPGCRNYYSVQNESYSADRFAGPLSDIKNNKVRASGGKPRTKAQSHSAAADNPAEHGAEQRI